MNTKVSTKVFLVEREVEGKVNKVNLEPLVYCGYMIDVIDIIKKDYEDSNFKLVDSYPYSESITGRMIYTLMYKSKVDPDLIATITISSAYEITA